MLPSVLCDVKSYISVLKQHHAFYVSKTEGATFYGSCVCQTLSTKGKERCDMFGYVLKQGAAGLSVTLRPTKTVIDRCVNVPAIGMLLGAMVAAGGPHVYHCWLYLNSRQRMLGT